MVVFEKVKVDLLGIVKNALPLIHALKDRTSETYCTTHELVTTLFQSLWTRPTRVVLVDVFARLADMHQNLLTTEHAFLYPRPRRTIHPECLSLKRFIDLVAAYPSSEYEKTFVKVLYPGIRYCLRSKIKLIPLEVLGVLTHTVARCDSISTLAQLRRLFADGLSKILIRSGVLRIAGSGSKHS
jgi:U3 small nucleolar RNA-associated protein 20